MGCAGCRAALLHHRVWRAGEKIVFSRTLDSVDTPRTRLEAAFDPATFRALVADHARASVAGPELAGQALRAGLVDEVHLYVLPVVLGGGTPMLPSGVRVDLELIAKRAFAGGAVHLGYRVTNKQA